MYQKDTVQTINVADDGFLELDEEVQTTRTFSRKWATGALLSLAGLALLYNTDSTFHNMVEPMGFLGSSKASLSIVEAVANTASPQLHTEDLETGLLQDGVMKFANPLTTSWSCIDGRASEPVFGTPGGDAGEFITAMYATIHRASVNVIDTTFTVKDAFNKYLSSEVWPSRPFRLHTDSKAVSAAKASLKGDATDLLLFPEDSASMNKILDSVVANPMYLGCGHLKLMMQNPDKYDVPTEATVAMIQAFFRYSWEHDDGKTQTHIHTHGEKSVTHNHDDQDDTHSHEGEFDAGVDQTSVLAGNAELIVLPGAHAEESVMSIVGKYDPKCAPMFWPSMPAGNKRRQYFVNHSSGPVIEGQRRKNIRFFMNYFKVKDVTENEILDYYNEMSGKQIGATAGVLAPKLPHHHVTVEGGC